MNAHEASKLSQRSVQSEINAILEKIEKACSKGHTCITIGNLFRSPSSAVIRYFEEKDYTYCARNSTLFW
jgi:hypothetical protein